jgi:hypothetical protein
LGSTDRPLISDCGQLGACWAAMSDHRDELAIPLELAAAAKRAQRQGWLARLPAAIRDLQTDWSIRVGEPFQPRGADGVGGPSDPRR